MLVLQPDQPAAWQALAQALAADIFVAVHLTLNSQNLSNMPELLRRLSEMGVTAVSLSAATPELQDALQQLRNQADDLRISLVWDLPVPYSALNPVALEVTGVSPAMGAGRSWLYVEPDGDVLPAQGENKVLGNLLRDTWEEIWQDK
jgi:MoaA/NifB/PqqE/SkfB family radical SAM enzyme